MQRLLPLALALAALAAGVTEAAASDDAFDAGGARRARVKLVACSRTAHSAVFYARMRRVPGTRRMALRMTLLSRADAAPWRALDLQGLARWRRSRRGVSAFGYRQRVQGLREGYAYRMLVRFRWIGPGGHTLRVARVRSAPCRQFELLPNLTVDAVSVRATSRLGIDMYRVRVTNAGRARAISPRVSLAVDGSTADTEERRALGPGESWIVDFVAPACEHQAEAVVDPDGAIRESSEVDNRAAFSCGG